jgi:anaerobic selenocysteine-containing dehydrogenase
MVRIYTDKNGKFIRVEGDENDPYNQGRLCPRCLALPEVVYHKDRLQYPMKRVGKRGENNWQRITWDEAYDTILERFNSIKQRFGPESVVFAQGTGRDIAQYIQRLAFSFGSPNWAYLLSGLACYMPRIAATYGMTGSFWIVDCSQALEKRYDDPRYRVPGCVAIWGNNPVHSSADGFYGHWIVDLLKRGTKLIVIDPRLTWLASKAALWLQIRPGTDAALALGILNIIINEKLYDKEFVEKWTLGFDALAERVQQYPVERVSEITWIPKEKIIAAARMFAQCGPSAIQWGLAIDMTKEALPAAQALASLWSITGNCDVPGGMIPSLFIHNTGVGWGRELISDEVFQKQFGRAKYPLFNYGFLFASSDSIFEALETGKPYPIKGWWLQTTNPLACTAAQPKKLLEGFLQSEFNVVVDLFMTPTAMAMADIVLPSATFLERDGCRAVEGIQFGATINKAIEPVGEAKPDVQINLELGKRISPEAWPWETVQEMLSTFYENSYIHESFTYVREQQPIYRPWQYKKYEKGLAREDGEPGFNTASGKIELRSDVCEQCGLDPLPYFEEPTESPYSTPELYKKYPLILTTGMRHGARFHSEHRQIPHLRALSPDPTVELHPETATQYGINTGDWVWIENHRGRARRKAKVTPTIDPRVVATDHGWWFPEESPEKLYKVWDLNINQLMQNLPGKSGFGANFKALLCKIYKVQEGEM